MASEANKISLRGQIVGLHRVGYSEREISRQLGVSRPTVHLWVTRYEEEGNLRSRHRGGHPKSTTEDQDQRIVGLSREAPHTPATRIPALLDLQCSVSTVKRRLSRAGRRGKFWQ